MLIEVSIIEEGVYFDVQVWDIEEQGRVEDLERTFDTEKEASSYVNELIEDKKYDVKIRNF